VREALELAHVVHEQGWVDNVTRGFFLADQKDPPSPDKLETWPVEQQAAYYARRGIMAVGPVIGSQTLSLVAKIKAIWEKWEQMNGDNRPLVRSTAGPRRDFDINLDGMAHYGMLPDLLQDIRNSGLTAEDFKPLFRSANDYVQMWDAIDQRAAEIARQMSY
jgi:hypothetical protein